MSVAVYSAVRKLSDVLQSSFAFGMITSRHYALDFPEIQLMSQLIVAVKVLQGFDDVERRRGNGTRTRGIEDRLGGLADGHVRCRGTMDGQ